MRRLTDQRKRRRAMRETRTPTTTLLASATSDVRAPSTPTVPFPPIHQNPARSPIAAQRSSPGHERKSTSRIRSFDASGTACRARIAAVFDSGRPARPCPRGSGKESGMSGDKRRGRLDAAS